MIPSTTTNQPYISRLSLRRALRSLMAARTHMFEGNSFPIYLFYRNLHGTVTHIKILTNTHLFTKPILVNYIVYPFK